MNLHILLWVIQLVSDSVEFVSKFKDSNPICSFSFPLRKLTKPLFLSSTPNPHLDVAGNSFPSLMMLSRFTVEETDINNALVLSMGCICIALRMLRTQFSPPNPLFLSFCMAIIEVSAR